MGKSRVPGPIGNGAPYALVPAHTPGPYGMNDAADPNARAVPGDVRGPLGQWAELLRHGHPSSSTGRGGRGMQTQGQKWGTPAAPEIYWSGGIKGDLDDHPSKYHTLNNFGNTELLYTLRIKNLGQCLLCLEAQYRNKIAGLERAWIVVEAQRGKTDEVTRRLSAHSSLHLRLFCVRDHTEIGSWCEGTAESMLQN